MFVGYSDTPVFSVPIVLRLAPLVMSALHAPGAALQII